MVKFFYNHIAFPLLLSALRVLSIFNPKIREGFRARAKKPWIASFAKMNKPWIWIHTSSGEIEYAKPLIRKLKEKNEYRILITYFSPSVANQLQKLKEIDLAVPMPWDNPHSWTEFLNHYQPIGLCIARTDLWPEMIWSTHAKQIPIILFSATLSENSWKLRSSLGRFFYSQVIKDISLISAVSDDDAKGFKLISPLTNVTVDGDTRFDQAFFRLQENRALKDFVRRDESETLFVAGSTWPEDESVLLKGLLAPIRKGLRVIIAPHEPHPKHIQALESFFKSRYIDAVCYSKTDHWPERTVLIIDQVGLLADLYKGASIAFVGGSFRKTIHSVMEPSSCGCLVLMGPKHVNNREALALKHDGKAMVMTQSRHFEDFLTLEMSTPPSIKEKRRHNIVEWNQKRRGATDIVFKTILEFVSNPKPAINFEDHGRGVAYDPKTDVRREKN